MEGGKIPYRKKYNQAYIRKYFSKKANDGTSVAQKMADAQKEWKAITLETNNVNFDDDEQRNNFREKYLRELSDDDIINYVKEEKPKPPKPARNENEYSGSDLYIAFCKYYAEKKQIKYHEVIKLIKQRKDAKVKTPWDVFKINYKPELQVRILINQLRELKNKPKNAAAKTTKKRKIPESLKISNPKLTHKKWRNFTMDKKRMQEIQEILRKRQEGKKGAAAADPNVAHLQNVLENELDGNRGGGYGFYGGGSSESDSDYSSSDSDSEQYGGGSDSDDEGFYGGGGFYGGARYASSTSSSDSESDSDYDSDY